MVVPDFERLAETFVAVPATGVTSKAALWERYIDVLRFKVAPVVRSLGAERVITWYCFHAHGRDEGVPTHAGDTNGYVHLRVQLGSHVGLDDLKAKLPPDFVMTQMVGQPVPNTLDNVVVGMLKQDDARYGWGIVGLASQFVLEMLQAHDPAVSVPAANVQQFVHYIWNQVQGETAGIQVR